MAPNNIATTDYVKDFVNGVESEAASRINALEMSKQTKVMFSPVTVGGEEEKTVEGAISAINTLTAENKTNITNLNDIVGSSNRNLYEGSPSFDGYEATQRWTKQNEMYNGHEVYKRNSDDDYHGLWWGMYKRLYVQPGIYTFSVSAKTDIPNTCVQTYIKINGSSTPLYPNEIGARYLGTDWTTLSHTFEVYSAGYIEPRIELSGQGESGGLYISEYKLEKGPVATPYEPCYPQLAPAVNTLTTQVNDLVNTIKNEKIIFGFRIDPSESDSSDCVSYLADAIGMTPAYMDSTAFNYGSWENAFFMPKPCMLRYDGTVAYYLDPNDYTKKADGSASDISDFSFPGNAMMEFPLIWYKWVQGSNSGEGYFYVANYQVDGTYKCYSNLDCNGNVIEHFYMPIYNGVTYDGKLRSLSGKKMTNYTTTGYDSSATYAVNATVNYQGKMYRCTTAVSSAEAFDATKWEQFAFNGHTSGEEEINQAMANNTTSEIEWYTDQWCDRVLIQGLLVLMSKSIDTQGKFGRGIDSGDESAKENYVTGSLNNKGLFYGSISNGSTAVKVFGMENYWALQWRRVAGLIGSTENGNDTYLYKMTASTADGTTVKGYNTTGSGYITASGRPSEHNWLKKMQFGQFGTLPLEVGSYNTQYYKDHYWTGTGYALFGGASTYGSVCGAFYLDLGDGVGYRFWNVGAAPSCKPCLRG